MALVQLDSISDVQNAKKFIPLAIGINHMSKLGISNAVQPAM